MQNENKLGVMPIKKLIWNMSLPIIISMLVQALYNIVDSVFVSWVSEASLTAVSLAFPAQNLMISLAAGTAVGVNALMGRALGAKDQKRADTVAMNGLFLALVGFVLCAVLGLTLSDFYFRSQTDVEEIIQMGNQYLMIVMGASFGAFGQMMLERLLQGTGHSILSMYTQGAGAIINIILDPIFIFVFKLGVAGAAIATVIGQIFACVFALVESYEVESVSYDAQKVYRIKDDIIVGMVGSSLGYNNLFQYVIHDQKVDADVANEIKDYKDFVADWLNYQFE